MYGNPSMALYSASRPNRTVTLHKNGCRFVPRKTLRPCGCGAGSPRGNQRWWCEEHVRMDAVERFMRTRFWALLLCDRCYGRRGVGELFG
ncbi:MAG: hypothetical protein KatS3mg076_3241 [Candidatus Binatia bacterium]|nr:MAG: hypothetical protein KatS3mg076_3241 [Candidatus Binatia bacterium]